ncbi:MAG: LacI family transcriptional regulator, partial [Armatimonadetes bacterium]|nr:LacI family transcriptional regulator [Armatimonadota bacterium]
MRKRNPTIKEVAKEAGVSISTVSNVLTNKRKAYSEETARRVWEAVHRLGYRRNLIARSLVHRRTFTIGVVVEYLSGSVFRNTYFGVVLDGVLEAATEREYHVKIIRVRPNAYEKAVDHIEDGSMDGVVLASLAADNPIARYMAQSRVPAVMAGSVLPDMEIPYVDVDDLTAMYRAVKWLIELGHRRIGIITGDLRKWSARRREQGYLMALREAGIEPHPSWRYEGDYRLESGEAGMRFLLQADPAPTAVVCGNDRTALGVLRVLREKGIRVPEQVSVLGFDDDESAALSVPPLTTVRQPM